jgi:hypothetical protein
MNPFNPDTRTATADGNLTSDGRWDYTWDAENRLQNAKDKNEPKNQHELNLV